MKPPWVFPGALVRLKARGNAPIPRDTHGERVYPSEVRGEVLEAEGGGLVARFGQQTIPLSPFPARLAPVLFRDWHTRAEAFYSKAFVFDVQQAKEILLKSPRFSRPLDVPSLAPMLSPPLSVRKAHPTLSFAQDAAPYVSVDWILVPYADTDIPVLLAHVRGKLIPVDGWHRIAKALTTSLKILPCVHLSPVESARCTR